MKERVVSELCFNCKLVECCNVQNDKVTKCRNFFGDLCQTCKENHACPLQTNGNKSECKWYEPVQIKTAQVLNEEM